MDSVSVGDPVIVEPVGWVPREGMVLSQHGRIVSASVTTEGTTPVYEVSIIPFGWMPRAGQEGTREKGRVYTSPSRAGVITAGGDPGTAGGVHTPCLFIRQGHSGGLIYVEDLESTPEKGEIVSSHQRWEDPQSQSCLLGPTLTAQCSLCRACKPSLAWSVALSLLVLKLS